MSQLLRMSRPKRFIGNDLIRQSEVVSTGADPDNDIAFVVGVVAGQPHRLAIVTGSEGCVVYRSMSLDEAECFARSMLVQIERERTV